MNRKIEKEVSAEVLKQYKLLLKACRHLPDAIDNTLLRKAFEDVVELFSDKLRENGDSYIIHAVSVARIVAEEMELDLTSIVSALLQDLPRHPDTSRATFEKKYGQKISGIVFNLHRISELRMQKVNMNSENFIQLLLTLSDDIRVILIKLADRLHLMRLIELSPLQSQIQIAQETSGLYAPLAHRLGLFRIKTELEELAMKFSFPEFFHNISRKIEESRNEQTAYFSEFITPLRKELRANNIEFEIKYRTKSIPSIWNKMKKQGIDFEQVYDYFAIRIITHSTLATEKSDCWKVYSVVTNIYQPNPSRMRDWISAPKANGYESLHTTVAGPKDKWVEVQIRSIRMDIAAEKGRAAHWKYKVGPGSSSDATDHWLNNIRSVLENYSPGEDEIDQSAKMELFSDYVYAYTPQGDIRKLKAGATVLDFAFDIHSEIGQKCTGAKVNDSYVTLKQVLKTGDQIEIITSKNQKPNKDWLNFVTTQKAITRIKRCLKDEEYRDADIGKGMLIRKLGQLKIAFNDELTNKLVNYFKALSSLDLFHGIAMEKYDLQKVKDFFHSSAKIDEPQPVEKPFTRAQSVTSRHEFEKALVIVNENTPMKDVKLARCCQPVPGDEIFGFITVQEGIKIHRTNCTNAPQMFARYAYRTVTARWVNESEVSDYIASLHITGEDSIGILNSISDILTRELKANIRSINLNSNFGKFDGTITINVGGKSHLDLVIAKLSKVKGVKRVVRVR